VYKVIILKTPEKYLKKLSGKIAKSISAKIDLLKTDPYLPGYAAIIGKENTYRLRAGDYRLFILFTTKR
jgi:mRNA-degrading endonuclease RelE of RelBE toxin-antitoxin system